MHLKNNKFQPVRKLYDHLNTIIHIHIKAYNKITISIALILKDILLRQMTKQLRKQKTYLFFSLMRSSVPRNAPMCCVIPPASCAAIWLFLRLSSREVFPWSTWPMMVTTGARGTNWAGSGGGLTTIQTEMDKWYIQKTIQLKSLLKLSSLYLDIFVFSDFGFYQFGPFVFHSRSLYCFFYPFLLQHCVMLQLVQIDICVQQGLIDVI